MPPIFCIKGADFGFFMQNFRIFGAERTILRHFQLIFRPSTHVKSLQTLGRSLLFGISYVCPKNYDFSESCYENLTSRTSTISLFSAQSATDYLSELPK